MDELEILDLNLSPEEEMLAFLQKRGLIAKNKTMNDLTSAEKSILEAEVERKKIKSNPYEYFQSVHKEYLEFTKQRRVNKVSDYYEHASRR